MLIKIWTIERDLCFVHKHKSVYHCFSMDTNQTSYGTGKSTHVVWRTYCILKKAISTFCTYFMSNIGINRSFDDFTWQD